MNKKVKSILILIITVLAAIVVENLLIDAYVAKTFTEDMYGFRDFIVSLFQIVKLFANAGTMYLGYIAYKFLDFFN